MKRKIRLWQSGLLYTAIVFFLVFCPASAWAVQHHGGAEGLAAHEIGHFLFIVGMFFLLYRLYRGHVSGPGWFEFRAFLWLIILWNILTFCGHLQWEFMSADKFIHTDGRITAFTISTPGDVFFYFSRLDHLLSLPAFVFLAAALHKWRKTA